MQPLRWYQTSPSGARCRRCAATPGHSPPGGALSVLGPPLNKNSCDTNGNIVPRGNWRSEMGFTSIRECLKSYCTCRLPAPQCHNRSVTAVGPICARPAGEFLKHLRDGVFVGTFKGTIRPLEPVCIAVVDCYLPCRAWCRTLLLKLHQQHRQGTSSHVVREKPSG